MASRVVVVGGGVIGAACTYFLTAAGAEVTLVEAQVVGGGTSSRCDGNVLAIDKSPGFDSQLGLRSQKLLAELAHVLGDFEYRSPGSYLVCDNDDEVEPAHTWTEALRESGLPVEFLEREEVHRRLPDLAADVPAGLYCASDATLNPLLYVQGLVAWARERGASVRDRSPVAALDAGDGRVRGVVLASGEHLAADATVVAAGIATPALVAPLGIELPIRPRKGHLIVSARGRRFGDAKVMEFGYLMSKFGLERRVPPDVERYGVALVYEPTRAGNFLLGSSREFVGEDTESDPEVVRTIARRALRFYPGMRAATVVRTYAGLRPWTPDHLPVVSAAESVPGLFVAAGHEGDGISLAAVTGEIVRDLVLGRETALDVAPLRLGRFGLGAA